MHQHRMHKWQLAFDRCRILFAQHNSFFGKTSSKSASAPILLSIYIYSYLFFLYFLCCNWWRSRWMLKCSKPIKCGQVKCNCINLFGQQVIRIWCGHQTTEWTNWLNKKNTISHLFCGVAMNIESVFNMNLYFSDCSQYVIIFDTKSTRL